MTFSSKLIPYHGLLNTLAVVYATVCLSKLITHTISFMHEKNTYRTHFHSSLWVVKLSLGGGNNSAIHVHALNIISELAIF